MTENPEKPVLLHRQLNSTVDYTEALDTLIELARHRLRIFDYNLEDGGYTTLRRYELLRTFLLASRSNRLEIVLHDSDYLTRFCPRISSLLKQFSHAITIQETTPQAKGIYDPFAIADEACFLHRFHYDNPRALLALNDIEGSHVLIKRFEEIRAASVQAITTTTLGL
ncbi:hypothetical protein SCD_n01246 [Sulfuricella denitrificans skB26]|uniref:DUF7931 domain-containing protein n=1 Tax=Sulfuricella denitrificans (strain DSM 22764 / NBRC 105220 / skB26) TaxID=1163617 RepID=S6AA16_SULDS|nr:hypothetical protein [Sulfuricella denitrificans]BAN35075.1 hypothetical protein SCD_n01246 [Sulfuricella denitrificans skB26]